MLCSSPRACRALTRPPPPHPTPQPPTPPPAAHHGSLAMRGHVVVAYGRRGTGNRGWVHRCAPCVRAQPERPQSGPPRAAWPAALAPSRPQPCWLPTCPLRARRALTFVGVDPGCPPAFWHHLQGGQAAAIRGSRQVGMVAPRLAAMTDSSAWPCCHQLGCHHLHSCSSTTGRALLKKVSMSTRTSGSAFSLIVREADVCWTACGVPAERQQMAVN